AALAGQRAAGTPRQRGEGAEEILRISDRGARRGIRLPEQRPQPAGAAGDAGEKAGERAVPTRQPERLERAVVARVGERRAAGRARRREEGATPLAVQRRRQQPGLPPAP